MLIHTLYVYLTLKQIQYIFFARPFQTASIHKPQTSKPLRCKH